MELARDAYRLAPDDPEVIGLLGRLVLESGGDAKWALSLLQQSTGRQSPGPDSLYDLARAQFAAGQIADAQSTLQQACQSTAAFARKADAQQFLSLLKAALTPDGAVAAEAAAQKLYQSNPHDLIGLFVVARGRHAKREDQGAIDAYEQLLKRDQNFTPARKYLSALYADLGNFQKSYELASKARESSPDDGEIARTLGISLYNRGDFENSVRLLNESIERGNEDGPGAYYLGMAHYKMSKKKDKPAEQKASKTALQRALALNVPTNLATEAKKVLAELN